MDKKEQREDQRDSVFLMATLRTATVEIPVKVRNLSAGGALIEGAVEVTRGDQVEVLIRNVGWVKGVVAWMALPRFGIAFSDIIDPKIARAPLLGTVTSKNAISDRDRLRRV